MGFHTHIEPDFEKAAQVAAQVLDIYDPTQMLPHFRRMARQYEQASEQAFIAQDFEATMEGVAVQAARHEINEVMMDLAFGMSEGGGMKTVVERAVKNGRAINEEGVRRIAPELLAPGGEREPQLVLTSSIAGEKYMELQAYRAMQKLVEIYSASLMATVEKYSSDRALQSQMYFQPRNEVLNDVCRQIDRDIHFLTHYDRETRPLTPRDYVPV